MRILTLALLVCLQSPIAEAHVSSISAGTGSAGRGVSEPLENPYLNPAGLPFQKGYYFGMGFARTRTESYGNQDLFTLALTDNMPDTVLPTSLAFTEAKNPDLGPEGLRRDIRVGIGNFYSGRTALGFALNYRMSRSPAFNQQQINGSLGFMTPLRRDIGLGITWENLVPRSSDLPESERLNSNLAFGLSYNYKRFLRLRGDLISQPGNNLGRPILAAGLENYWNRWLIFRIGAQRDPAQEKTTNSLGLGFAGPRFELQYAFQSIQGPQESDGRHSIDLGIPIW